MLVWRGKRTSIRTTQRSVNQPPPNTNHISHPSVLPGKMAVRLDLPRLAGLPVSWFAIGAVVLLLASSVSVFRYSMFTSRTHGMKLISIV